MRQGERQPQRGGMVELALCADQVGRHHGFSMPWPQRVQGAQQPGGQ